MPIYYFQVTLLLWETTINAIFPPVLWFDTIKVVGL